MSNTGSSMEDKENPVSYTEQQIALLRAQLQGSARTPADKGYDKALQSWDAVTFDQHPALIVLPATTADVQAAVNFARELDIPIAVQGGGHGHPYPADGTLLVNFVNMTGVSFSAEAATTATGCVEPGVLFSQLVEAAQAHNLAPLSGFATSVGVKAICSAGDWLVDTSVWVSGCEYPLG